jgi:hypothetical protein
MSFSIAFQQEPLLYPYDDPTTPAASGVLVLGDYKEHFLASLYQWKQHDYQRQWRLAIEALLSGRNKAALITEYVSPEFATHLVWWPMYLVANKVFIQNQLLFYDQLTESFSEENALLFVRNRQTMTPEGNQISEWAVTLSEVEEFAGTL